MSVNFKRIRWSGIYSFGKEEQSFDYKPGFYLILGRNGAGKSSFLNLLSLCLFDKSPSLNKRNAINESLGNGYIKLDFSVDDVDYEISYTRKKASLEWVLESGGVPKVDGAGTGAYIEELLGFGYNQFINSFYLTQSGSLSMQLVYGKPAERLDILSNIFDLEKFTECSARAREKVQEKEKEAVDLNDKIMRLRGELDSYQVEGEYTLEEHLRHKKIIEKKIKELKSELKDVSDLKAKVSGLREEQRDLIDKGRKLGEEGTELSLVEQKAIREIESIDKEIALWDDYEKEKETIEELKKAIEDFELSKESLDVKKDAYTENKIKLESELKAIGGKLKNIQADKGQCEYCGSIVDKDHLETYYIEITEDRNVKDKELSDTLLDLDTTNKLIDIDVKMINESKSKLQEIERKYINLSEDDKETLLEDKMRSDEDLGEVQRRIGSNRLNSESISEWLEKNYQLVEKLEKDMEEVTKVEKEIDVLEQNLRYIEEEIKDIEEKKEKIMSLNWEIEAFVNQINDLKDIENHYKFWVRGFKDIEILRLCRMLDSINIKMSNLLESFGMACSLDVLEEKKSSKNSFSLDDFKRKVNLFVEAEGKKKTPIEGYSGGEKQLIALSLILSMGERVSDVNFLGLDEVFGALESVNRDRVLSLLDEERKSGVLSDKSVFVITHDDDVRSGIEWDGILTMDKASGYSVLQEG